MLFEGRALGTGRSFVIPVDVLQGGWTWPGGQGGVLLPRLGIVRGG